MIGGVARQTDQNRAFARQLAADSIASGDNVGWFEKLYAAAEHGTATVPWADFTPAAKLSFPAQKRTVLALTDAAGESLAFGPTLMAASARPGERGVAVFAAHRDTHFAFLGEVKTGDAITVQTLEGLRTFRVSHTEVVRWDQSGIEPNDNGPPRIALVTCWPLDAKMHGPMRYVVWAELDASKRL